MDKSLKWITLPPKKSSEAWNGPEVQVRLEVARIFVS